MLRNRIQLGIAFLIAFSCGVMAQSQKYSQPQIESSKLGKDNPHTQPPPTANFPTSQEITEAIAGGIERADEKRGTNHPAPPPDYSSWWFNFFLVGFTGSLAVFGAGQCCLIFRTLKATEIAANAAKDSADTAKDALVAGNRAWISVDSISVESQLMWDDKGARITIGTTIKNVGNSPALDIATEIHEFVFGRTNFDMGAAVIKYCAEARKRQLAREKIGEHGDVLFPGGTLSNNHGLLFTIKEIQSEAKCDGTFFSPVAVVCVDYKSSITEKKHTTGIAYWLLKVPQNAGGLPMMLPVGVTLDESEFGLARSPVGSFAD